jgi:hypothetical protein
MRLSVTGTLLAASLILIGDVRGADAALITGFGSSSLPGSGSVGPVGATPAPNNDNAAATNPNTVPYNLFVNALGLIEMEFVVTDSGGTTEYRFPQAFFNISSQSWTSFGFELGFGTGASFVRSTLNDALDFDVEDLTQTPFASAFPTLERQADTLHWSGATVGFVGRAIFDFAVDVPDDLRRVNPYGENRFTLRQTPNAPSPDAPPTGVPEPTTMTLMGVGLLGLAAAGRSRRAADARRRGV